MKWIDATDIDSWTRKPESKVYLPELVSRLIRSTAPKNISLQIPRGNQLYRGGWDGIVHSEEQTEFLPKGTSLWEFGAVNDPKSKADKDYEKRLEDHLSQNPSESTFVFVTTKIWEGKDDWAKARRDEEVWLNVLAYDANDLANWLSIAPVQSYWFATEIGKAPKDGVHSGIHHWNNWSTGQYFNIPPDLVTSGRQPFVEQLKKSLAGSPTVIPIQAATKDEAIAFFLASVSQFQVEHQEEIISRNVIVSDLQSFNVLVANGQNLIFILTGTSTNNPHFAVSKGHFVILPLGADEETTLPGLIQLPNIRREGFLIALQNAGIPSEKAETMSRETGRNMSIFRRMYGFDIEIPEWAKPENARDLIPALLIGKWRENVEADRKQLEKIALEPYATYIGKLSRWKNYADAPVRQIGNDWSLSSPLDAWLFLGKYISTADLENYRTTVITTLREPNPVYDLGRDQRFYANIQGITPVYSSMLREGLLQSLIMIAVFGDKFKIQTQTSAQSWVDGIAYSILKSADEKHWLTLNDLLRLLAEASPATFLSAVEASLKEDTPSILALFEESNVGIGPSSYHTELLWALEGIAWMPEYLGRATHCLIALTTIDPGGKLANRPINSLRTIFLPWIPRTLATASQRMEVLKSIKNKAPDLCWKLGLDLLPEYHSTSMPTFNFRWRMFDKTVNRITYAEIHSVTSQVLDLLLSFAGNDEQKLLELVNQIPTLQQADVEKIINYIGNNLHDIQDKDQTLRHGIRKLLHRHRAYADQDWTVPEEILQELEKFYNHFTPTDPIEANKWIFVDHWPQFIDGTPKDVPVADSEQIIFEHRLATLKQIRSDIGIEGVVSLAKELTPYVIGDIFAHTLASEQELTDLYKMIIEQKDMNSDVSASMVFRIFWLKGFSWIETLYRNLEKDNYSDEVLANVLIPIRSTNEVLDFVQSTPDNVSDIYWKNARPRVHDLNNNHRNNAIEKLLANGRFLTALEEVYLWVEKFDTEMLLQILEKIAKETTSENGHLDQYKVTHIFGELYKRADVEKQRMINLELPYLPILTRYGSPVKPEYIHRELADEPKTFVEVLSWLYKPADKTWEEARAGKTDEEIRRLAEGGYSLLESWKTIPGTRGDKTIDINYLIKWVTKVRELAAVANLLKNAESEIAKLLAYYPGKEEHWLPDEIMSILEHLLDELALRVFSSELFNKNGSSTRGPYDGGNREYGLSAYWKELGDYHSAKWPKTAAVFYGLAQQYSDIAIDEDNAVKKMDTEY